MELTRRVALFGLGGAAFLACGGGLSWVSLGYALAPGDAAIGLTVKQLAIVRALVETLCPADGGLPAGLALGVHQRIDEEVWSQTDAIRADLGAALAVVEHLPPRYGWLHRFSRLSVPDREAYLATLVARGPRPIVQAVGSLRQLCALFWFAHPDTWPAIGYDGPWVKTPVPPPSSRRYAALLAAARETA
ncbi:MAG: gluconate 2-dehydrogenase subunit 3 family protein [Myxococcota bacterium]